MKKVLIIAAILFLCMVNLSLSGCSTCGKNGLKEKNKALKDEIKDMAAAQAKEKAGMYMELGTAYVTAKDFKSAITAYNDSLALVSDNAEAHYNLGVLYQRYEENTRKALYHFNKFLSLNRSPQKRREVKYLINMLNSGRDWDTLY